MVRVVAILVLVAWLSAIAVGALSSSVLPAIALAVVGLVLAVIAWRKGGPALRNWRRKQRRLPVELREPGRRYGAVSPVPLDVLAALLASADLGVVRTGSDWIEVQARQALTRLQVRDPLAVVLADVRLETSVLEHALYLCDSLVPKLGPLTFCAEGVELSLDGTQPRAELEELLRQRLLNRVRRISDAIDEPGEDKKPRYLN
jgi:hypothetical protein